MRTGQLSVGRTGRDTIQENRYILRGVNLNSLAIFLGSGLTTGFIVLGFIVYYAGERLREQPQHEIGADEYAAYKGEVR